MLPDTLSEGERHCLEDVLRSYTAIQEQQAPVQQEDLVMPSAPMEEPQTRQAAQRPQGDRERESAPESSESDKTSTKISRGIVVGVFS